MNETTTAPTPATTRTKSGWRIGRWILITLAILATVIAVFYTEEDLRGMLAWDKRKSELEAQGIVMDWNKLIPAPIPDDQNFYTASTNIFLKFQQFKADATNEIEAARQSPWLKLDPGPHNAPLFPVLDTSDSAPIVVAKITISPHPTGTQSGSNNQAFAINDPAAPKQVQELIRSTVGQTISGAQGFDFSERNFARIWPTQIFMEADATPSVTDLAAFVPTNTIGEKGQLEVVATADPKIFQVQLTKNIRITAAADYLNWSDQFVPDFDEIREALKRPDAIIPGDYSQPYLMPIPNFVTLRALAQTLAQRAQCYLLLGEPDKALHELTLMHDVCRILEKPPTGKPESLVEAMINVAINGLYAAIIAEGLQRHAWQEPQLEALQEQLGQVNLPFFVADSFQCEPADESFDTLTIPPQKWFSNWAVHEKPHFPRDFALWLMPRGWVYQNAVVVTELDVKSLAVFDASTGTISPGKAEAAWRETDKALKHPSRFNMMASIAIPNFTRAFQVTAHNQTLVNQTQIACALERCRLVHGEYPDTLDVLVPKYIETLPNDVIGGQPLHYHRTADGKFLLYSIGWNEKDDGGKPSPKSKNNNWGIDLSRGDWVWPN